MKPRSLSSSAALPPITKVFTDILAFINLSLSTGALLSISKYSTFSPLLKKSSLAHFRPVSRLCVSEMLEDVIRAIIKSLRSLSLLSVLHTVPRVSTYCQRGHVLHSNSAAPQLSIWLRGPRQSKRPQYWCCGLGLFPISWTGHSQSYLEGFSCSRGVPFLFTFYILPPGRLPLICREHIIRFPTAKTG